MAHYMNNKYSWSVFPAARVPAWSDVVYRQQAAVYEAGRGQPLGTEGLCCQAQRPDLQVSTIIYMVGIKCVIISQLYASAKVTTTGH